MSEGQQSKKAKGTVFVLAEVCKGCSYCIEFCPSHCLQFSAAFNAKGYHFPVLAKPEDCSGCNLCGWYCPDFAIFGCRAAEVEQSAKPETPAASGQ
jgi:2-oxoglutarate ferredoxin oxidoreductase subunit delta